MKRGFSLMMAIIILVIVAVMSALILSFSSQTIKTTSNIYLREQAKIIALSSTEYALLALSGHNHYKNTNGCLKQVNIDLNNSSAGLCYEVNMSLSYITNGINSNWCDDNFRVLSNSLNYNDSNLTVIIDTIVHCTAENENIRFHRRTIQKP